MGFFDKTKDPKHIGILCKNDLELYYKKYSRLSYANVTST